MTLSPRSLLYKNKSFPLRISAVSVTKPQFPADVVTFTEEILNRKLHFLCSGVTYKKKRVIKIGSLMKTLNGNQEQL